MSGKRSLTLVGCGLIGALVALPRWSRFDGVKVFPTTLDFGQVGLFDRPHRDLTLVNHNDVPMVVTLGADCGCTDLSASHFELAPGERRVVTVTMRRTGSGDLIDHIRSVRQGLVVTASGEGVRSAREVELAIRFEEPLLVDEEACVYSSDPFSTAPHRIGISSAFPAEPPRVLRFPEFCRGIDVEWDRRSASGYLIVHGATDGSVGFREGDCEVELEPGEGSGSAGAAAWRVRIPLRQTVTAPCQIVPRVVALDHHDHAGKRSELRPRYGTAGLADFRFDEVSSAPAGIRARIDERDPRVAWVSLDEDFEGLPDRSGHVAFAIRATSTSGKRILFEDTVPVMIWEPSR